MKCVRNPNNGFSSTTYQVCGTMWYNRCLRSSIKCSSKTMTAWCSTINDKQDDGIPLNVHHFCTKGEHCCTTGISIEYHYLAFKRLYTKGHKHWHRLQNLAATLSPPFVLQLCGISPLSCSNLLRSSEITVYSYVSTGYKGLHTHGIAQTKKHTHPWKVCSKSFWAY
jgi:hypothetical protein